MARYHEEGANIKSDRKASETGEDRPRPPGSSRRKFVREAAIGAAAIGAGLALKGGAGGSGDVLAQSQENGQVTVDAVLLTYVSSPDGSSGSATLTLSSTFTSTFRLQAAASLTLSIGTSSTVTAGPISLTSGGTFSQAVSAQVTDAVTVNSTFTFQTGTPPPGQPDHTVFYGLQKPKVNFQGDPTRLLFKFLGADGIFTARADSLQTPGNWPFSQATINAMLAQYPPLTDPTGGTLTRPRFKKKFSLPTDAGVPNVVTFSTATGSAFSDQLTLTFGTTITDMVGFMDAGLRSTFSVGQTLNISMTAVEEITSNEIMNIAFTLNPVTGPRVFKVFRDKVFKTYLVIKGGAPALSGQPVVRGTIYDSNGNPIPGALVTLTQGNVDYAKITDGSGNYYIATESGDPLSTGLYPLNSGGMIQNVNVGSGNTYASMSGVDPGTAQSTYINDPLVY